MIYLPCVGLRGIVSCAVSVVACRALRYLLCYVHARMAAVIGNDTPGECALDGTSTQGSCSAGYGRIIAHNASLLTFECVHLIAHSSWHLLNHFPFASACHRHPLTRLTYRCTT